MNEDMRVRPRVKSVGKLSPVSPVTRPTTVPKPLVGAKLVRGTFSLVGTSAAGVVTRPLIQRLPAKSVDRSSQRHVSANTSVRSVLPSGLRHVAPTPLWLNAESTGLVSRRIELIVKKTRERAKGLCRSGAPL